MVLDSNLLSEKALDFIKAGAKLIPKDQISGTMYGQDTDIIKLDVSGVEIYFYRNSKGMGMRAFKHSIGHSV